MDCTLNLGALERGLPASPRSAVRAFAGLNHLFQHAKTGVPAEYPQIEETFAPEALQTIADWMAGL